MIISSNSETPIYEQIADNFREEILAGHIAPGEYLPSIRSLARDLKISVITTMKAYEKLAEEGLVTAVQGKGYFVNSVNHELVAEQHRRKVEMSLQDAIGYAKVADMTETELVDTLRELITIDKAGI